jgi:hypothetical protein
VKLSLQFFLAAALVIKLRSGTAPSLLLLVPLVAAVLAAVAVAAAVTVVLAVWFLLPGEPGGDVVPGSAINVKVRPLRPPASVALRACDLPLPVRRV